MTKRIQGKNNPQVTKANNKKTSAKQTQKKPQASLFNAQAEKKPFEADTIANNNQIFVFHNTKMGREMQKMIGMHEDGYGNAPSSITGNGNENLQWCAFTVTSALDKVCAKKKIKNPTKGFCAVNQYIEWGKSDKRYNAIKTQTSYNVSDRDKRRKEITEQIINMKEGDLIIWKSPYYAYTNVDGKGVNKTFSSSHIGMIEKVEINKFTGQFYVWVIEGNANEAKQNLFFERYLNKTDSIIGGQKAGEIVEVNNADGVIRKKYTVDDLAKFGYSGFIDMNGYSN